MNLKALFDRHNSPWPGHNAAVLARIDRLLMVDEFSGFQRLSDAKRSDLITLFNCLDLAQEEANAGTPPYRRLQCSNAIKRMLRR
jgi:hypothetical protein